MGWYSAWIVVVCSCALLVIVVRSMVAASVTSTVVGGKWSWWWGDKKCWKDHFRMWNQERSYSHNMQVSEHLRHKTCLPPF